jgi:hypothetical protein
VEITTFQDVVDDCVLAAWEGQVRLAELTDAEGVTDGYSLDLPNGRFEFAGASGQRLPARAHFVGTASPGDHRWLWGWHNVNEFPDAAVELVGRIRDFGERYGLAELTGAFQPIGVGLWEDASRYAWVSTVIGGGLPHYAFEADNGTIAVLLLESERFRPPPGSVIRGSTVIQQVLQEGVVADWPRALGSYAGLRGFSHQPGEDGVVTLSAADGRLTISFDEYGRIADLTGEFRSPEG